MKLLFSLIFILGFFSSTAQARHHDDDDDDINVCYNWNHEREPCNRYSLRRESEVALLGTSYYGDHDASFSGSFGEGLLLTTVKSYSSVRFLFGGQFLYSGAKMYVNQSTYNTTMMSADLLAGLSIKPIRDLAIQPVIEIDLMGGIKSLEVAGPPTGVENKNLKPSYGAKISLGLDLKVGRFTALRPAVEYEYNRLSGIVDGKKLNLDYLGVSLGLVFF